MEQEQTQDVGRIRAFVQKSMGKQLFDPPLHWYHMDLSSLKNQDVRLLLEQLQRKEKQINWKSHLAIVLQRNLIGEEICKQLHFKKLYNLRLLNLNGTFIGDSSCKNLIKAQLPKLQRLFLNDNCIGDKGCLYLSKGRWPQLKCLSLTNQSIDINIEKGCQPVAKGNWKMITELILFNNQLNTKGCVQISKGRWPNIIWLKLQGLFWKDKQKQLRNEDKAFLKQFLPVNSTLECYC